MGTVQEEGNEVVLNIHIPEGCPLGREAEERIFLNKRENPKEYPEQTGLQKALKQELIRGMKFGSGFGILKWENR